MHESTTIKNIILFLDFVCLSKIIRLKKRPEETIPERPLADTDNKNTKTEENISTVPIFLNFVICSNTPISKRIEETVFLLVLTKIVLGSLNNTKTKNMYKTIKI